MKGKRTMPKIKIVPLTGKLTEETAVLIKKCLPAINRYPLSPWNWDATPFTGKFIESRTIAKEAFDPEGSFVCITDKHVIAFALAAINKSGDTKTGFLSALIVAPGSRRQGLGSSLLQKVETYLAKHGINKINLGGANPLTLIGGMPINEDSIPFMFNRGYRSYEPGLLQLMTQDTTQFNLNPTIPALREKLETKGVTICFFEQKQLERAESYFKKHFPDWIGAVGALKENPPLDMLVAMRGEEIVGHSGPFAVVKSCLGGFNSMGITKEERGSGLGVALFNLMCSELKNRGARSISLTVEQLNNPALEIYIKAGFRVRYVVDYKITKDLGQ